MLTRFAALHDSRPCSLSPLLKIIVQSLRRGPCIAQCSLDFHHGAEAVLHYKTTKEYTMAVP